MNRRNNPGARPLGIWMYWRHRIVALMLVVLASLLFAPRPADAHASFSGSDPADGSSLAVAPSKVVLRFTEPVLLEAVDVRLVDASSGSSKPLVAVFGRSHSELSIDTQTLSTGAYVLQFAVTDAADLHRTAGSVSFGVGVAPPATQGSREFGSSIVISAAHFIADLLVIGLIGAIALLLLTASDAGTETASESRRDAEVPAGIGDAEVRAGIGDAEVPARAGDADVLVGGERRDRLAGRIPWLVLALALVDAFVIIDQAHTVGFGRVRFGALILSSDAGRALVLAAQAAVALWAVSTRDRRAPRGVVRWLLALAAVLLALSGGWGGHGSSGGGTVAGWLLRSAHVGSIGLWLGLVLVAWWVTVGDHLGVAVWRVVSTFAGIGIAVTAASGLLLAPRIAVNVTALLSSLSGRAVVVKAVVLLVLGAIGWRHRAVLGRGLVPRRRLLIADAIGLVVAVTAAVVIAGSPPARGERYSAVPVREPLTGTTQANDLTLTASLAPGYPGPNLLRIGVLNTRRPAPGTIDSVHVRIADANGQVVAESDDVPQSGIIQIAGVIVPTAGVYRLTLGVTRPQAVVPPASLDWNVPAKPVARVAEVVSRRPIAGPAELLALASLLLGGLVFFADRRSRTRPKRVASKSVEAQGA